MLYFSTNNMLSQSAGGCVHLAGQQTFSFCLWLNKKLKTKVDLGVLWKLFIVYSLKASYKYNYYLSDKKHHQ